MKSANHIKKLKNIILMFFVVFSLSPCPVKAVVFGTVNIDYSQPLNKFKVSGQLNSCQFSSQDNQQISVSEKAKFNRHKEPDYHVENPCYDGFCEVDFINYSTTLSGNDPPKYILYKRLKLDVA